MKMIQNKYLVFTTSFQDLPTLMGLKTGNGSLASETAKIAIQMATANASASLLKSIIRFELFVT